MLRIRKRTCAWSMLAVFALASVSVRAEDQPGGSMTIQPDVAYQTAIAAASSATDKDAFQNATDRLVGMGGSDRGQIVSQLLWYAAQNKDDPRAHALVGRALKRIDAPKSVIVTALVPHLENRDETIRAMTRDLLHGYDDASAERPPDFSTYRAILEADVRSGREPRASLVQFMYESDAGTALHTMVRASQLRRPEEIKPILWAEHVVADLFWKRRFGFIGRTGIEPAAVQELNKLSRHDRWWVRLYAAEIVRTNPELGTPELVSRLADDPNDLVKQSARRTTAGSPPASTRP